MAGTGQFRVTASELRVRDAPSTDGNIVGQLNQGDVVNSIDTSADGDWRQIQKDGLTGWSASQFLTPVSSATTTAPPSAVANWPLGVDLYAGNATDAAGFQNLKNQGKAFAIAKSSQGTTGDGRFANYYGWIRDSGMIRGSFHFFGNKRSTHPVWGGTVEDQANRVLSLITRLAPGDLAPALDLEDEPRDPASGKSADQGGRYPLDQGLQPTEDGYHYRHRPDGIQELLGDIQDFLNRIETALGRTPIIYTSHLWTDSDMMNDPQVMPQYPLWTVYHGQANMTGISVGAWGTDWDFIQYAEAGGRWWGLNPYAEPNINIGGLDFDAYKGTIYGLRGLADIGRPSVALDAGVPHIAYSEVDDNLHLLTGSPLAESQGTLPSLANPLTGADPALLVSAGSIFLYFRKDGHLVEAAATPGGSWDWQINQIEDVQRPIHDPRAITNGTARHVVYWGEDDDWYLINWDNSWTNSGAVLSLAGIKMSANQGQSTGQPIVYLAQGVVHVAGRAGAEGHLFDVWLESGAWKKDDLTALGRNLAPDMPAATHSPCAYETSSGAAIVFRAVGGSLWVMTRSDNAPTNLMTAIAGTRPAAGHPSCFVLNDEPHIVYRGSDRLIYDISLQGGAWHLQQVCSDQSAADPAATSDGKIGLMAARAIDGTILVAQFDGTQWTCSSTS